MYPVRTLSLLHGWQLLKRLLPACGLIGSLCAEPLTSPGRTTPKRGYLGVTLTEICPEVRAQTTLREGEGLMIGRVAEGSPAAQLGLLHYDILTRFNDQWIMSPAQFVTLVENAGPGSEIELTYLRRGTQVRSRVTLVPCPAEPPVSQGAPPLPEEMLTTVIRTLRDHPAALQTVYRMLHGPPGEALNLKLGHDPNQGSRLTLRDPEGTVQILIISDSQQISAWDTQGKLIFEGPGNTPDQLAQLPGTLRERVERLKTECLGPPLAAPATPAAQVTESPPPEPTPPTNR